MVPTSLCLPGAFLQGGSRGLRNELSSEDREPVTSTPPASQRQGLLCSGLEGGRRSQRPGGGGGAQAPCEVHGCS